ncbi:hypothetical protein Y032_0026g1351 [Ancylostoma ceylanicum]|nr:hypothetical protein Y032_0026g1351 [Ancylostoma ceylanicum]
MHAAVVSLVIREILSFSTEMLNFINIQFVMAVAMLHGAETIETDVGDELAIPFPFLTCATVLCIPDYKCVMVEPANCVGCRAVPRCVQRECDTSCVLPCAFLSRCVLVATDCCPKATCRRRPIIFTIEPPPEETIRFTIEPPKVTAIVKPGDPVMQIP